MKLYIVVCCLLVSSCASHQNSCRNNSESTLSERQCTELATLISEEKLSLSRLFVELGTPKKIVSSKDDKLGESIIFEYEFCYSNRDIGYFWVMLDNSIVKISGFPSENAETQREKIQ